jgi:predicted negative regulator of RcsB-dependent stress response
VEGYISEQEQIERIKAWWKENGRSIFWGLAIGLAGVYGWQTWQGNVAGQMEDASSGFQQMLGQIAGKKPDEAKKTGGRIVAKFERSPYAVMASMTLAKLAVEANDFAAAKKHLEWARDHAADGEIIPVIRMRLARLYLAEGDNVQAWTILQGIPQASASKLSSYQELKGDILVTQGKIAEARQAYTEALTLRGEGNAESSVLQLKLNDLGAP